MIGQSRPEKGKAVNSDVRRVEASPSLRTRAGKFHQYTPLVATIEYVLNQVTGRGLLRDPPSLRTDPTGDTASSQRSYVREARRWRWSGESDPDGGVHLRGLTICLQHYLGEVDPQRAESSGLHLPLGHEVFYPERDWSL
ncbi:hypothetical protein TIFTF001_029486 [Ficus carica]|uniref:Uncharacterized protein n=1 Tax=Ficus carica TaxID=3494 RepID=A0AA88J3F6_FICCA|nr:hypothetical protein TIFTF001_029486 [Ficus carica]